MFEFILYDSSKYAAKSQQFLFLFIFFIISFTKTGCNCAVAFETSGRHTKQNRFAKLVFHQFCSCASENARGTINLWEKNRAQKTQKSIHELETLEQEKLTQLVPFRATLTLEVRFFSASVIINLRLYTQSPTISNAFGFFIRLSFQIQIKKKKQFKRIKNKQLHFKFIARMY